VHDDGHVEMAGAFYPTRSRSCTPREGLDFNENDAGDLRVNLSEVVANFNHEEGIDYEEDDDFAGGGDLVTIMDRVGHGDSRPVPGARGDPPHEREELLPPRPAGESLRGEGRCGTCHA
jgi:hypothetical protein